MDRLRRSDSYLWICWCWRQDNVEWDTLSLPGGFFFLSPSRMRSHNTDWICSWNVITVKNDRTVAHVKKLCWRHWTRFGLFVLIQIHTTPYTNCWGGTLRKNQEKKKETLPHTSEAEKAAAPSPSPLRFLLHWTPCGSFRAAGRGPASPSPASLWSTGQRSEVPGGREERKRRNNSFLTVWSHSLSRPCQRVFSGPEGGNVRLSS